METWDNLDLKNHLNDIETEKICVLLFYFGELPAWIDIWKHTAALNSTINFILFQDKIQTINEGNVSLIRFSLGEFNRNPKLAELGISCKSPYKICDFRPLFGYLFSEILSDYTYWGWGDLDVFYGDLSETVAPGFGRYDYIATGWNGESGPLAFFRNTEAVNHLWRRIPDVREKLNSRESFALDEKDFLDLLRDNVDCDIEFRECLKDLPATWRDGKLTSRKSGRQYALHHFGGHVGGSQPQINKMSAKLLRHIRHGGGFVIKRNFKVARSHWWH